MECSKQSTMYMETWDKNSLIGKNRFFFFFFFAKFSSLIHGKYLCTV